MAYRCFLVLIAFVGILSSGCASAPPSSVAVTAAEESSVMARLSQAIDFVKDAKDASVAKAISSAGNNPISLRSDSLANRTKTVDALKSACQAGKYVEVLLYRANASAGQELANSCIRVVKSSDPRLNQQEVLLIGATLYVAGYVSKTTPQQLQQEIAFRNFIKASSSL